MASFGEAPRTWMVAVERPHLHELGELPHELVVVLHAARRVDENTVVAQGLGLGHRPARYLVQG